METRAGSTVVIIAVIIVGKKTVSAIIYHCLLMATTDELVIVDITAFLTETFVVTLQCRFSGYPYKEQNSIKVENDETFTNLRKESQLTSPTQIFTENH